MATKNCMQCNKEFESKLSSGVEQKYCSKQCRMKSANDRRLETIKTNIVNEIKGSSILQQERNTESLDRVQRENTRTPYGFGNVTDSHLATIKELYEAKTETNFYKLKVDQLEKENNELKMELIESENDECEENEENNNGWLGSVEKTLPTLVKSYRDDPEATMGFLSNSANMIFNSIFKSKTNASSIPS